MDCFTLLFFNNKYKFKSKSSKFWNSLNYGIKCGKHNARQWLRQCKYMKWGTTSPIRDFKPLCSPAITIQPSIPANLVRFKSASFFSKKSIIVSKIVKASTRRSCSNSRKWFWISPSFTILTFRHSSDLLLSSVDSSSNSVKSWHFFISLRIHWWLSQTEQRY